MSERFRIHELVRLAEMALDATGSAAVSGRVREVPDVRTLRYYTTIGLLDRPCEMRGRTAFYGRRHVWQLVAIKRLQAQGLSLSDVQQRLIGIENRELSRLATLPSGFLDNVSSLLANSEDVIESPPAVAPTRRSRFWETEIKDSDCKPHAGIQAKTVLQVPLSPGVSLMLEGASLEAIDADAWKRLQPAIDRLLTALKDEGVLPRKVGT